VDERLARLGVVVVQDALAADDLDFLGASGLALLGAFVAGALVGGTMVGLTAGGSVRFLSSCSTCPAGTIIFPSKLFVIVTLSTSEEISSPVIRSPLRRCNVTVSAPHA